MWNTVVLQNKLGVSGMIEKKIRENSDTNISTVSKQIFREAIQNKAYYAIVRLGNFHYASAVIFE